MKAFVKIIFLGAMLFASQLTLADSGLSKDVPITVTVAASVQDQITKLPLPEKKRAEEALKIGAAFMQQYLDGLVCDTENQYWDDETGRLVAMDNYDWNEKFCSNIESPKVSGFKSHSRVLREMCPQVFLFALQLEDGGVSLTYQMIKLGALIYSSGNDIDAFTQGAVEKEQIIVAVNANNRVYKMIPKDWNQEMAYSRGINDMKFDVANTEKFLKHSTPIIGETLASIKAKYNRYKRLIKQIEQQAAQVCK